MSGKVTNDQVSTTMFKVDDFRKAVNYENPKNKGYVRFVPDGKGGVTLAKVNNKIDLFINWRTNINAEKNKAIREKFADFMASVPADGPLIVCGEDEPAVSVAQTLGRPFLTYGIGEDFDFAVVDYNPHGVGSDFCLRLPDGRTVESGITQNPGRHNVLNAASVIGLAYALGLDADAAAQAMRTFAGVRRRFDLVGEAAGVTIVDDYAHHPTEIAATIKAASELGYNRVHILFPPHRYSRAPLFTEVLREEFGSAFDAADTVTFMNVYPAGEAPVPGVSGQTFLNVIEAHPGHPQTHYVPRLQDAVPHMVNLAQVGDLVITMGAGDVTAIGPELLRALQEQG